MQKMAKMMLKAELKADIQALFQPRRPNQSIRCKFPARSQWLNAATRQYFK